MPDNQTNARLDPLDVCPNVVDPAGHGIQSQPYQFQFESNCLGNKNSARCRFRPNFIWTIHYYTATGTSYTEQWQDVTAGDFSKIRLYLYDRVPYAAGPYTPATPTNGQATQAGGNNNFSAVPYPNLGCLQAPVNTAQPGDPITRARLECTGYSCGNTQGDDTDEIQIRYYGRQPEAITVGGEQPLCRNIAVPVSVSPVFGATNYIWYTSGLNGAVISGINGNNATLNVSGVPAGTNTIILRVAAQDNAHCGNIVSEVRELVVNLAPSSAPPQSIGLSGGLCPTTTVKFLTATSASASSADKYFWTVAGAGAYLLEDNNTPVSQRPGTAQQRIVTPNPGTVTVTATVKSDDCGGYSVALARSFQVGNVAPVCPTQYTGPNAWVGNTCPSPNRIRIAAVDGLNYYPLNIGGAYAGNIQPAGARVTQVTQPTTASPIFDIILAPNAAGFYPSSFDLYVNVVSPCPGSGNSGSIVCLLPVKVTSLLTCSQPEARNAPGTEPEAFATLYPNPTRDEMRIVPPADVRYQWVKVLDHLGRVVAQQQNENGAGVTVLSLKKLSTGLYLVQLFDGQRLSTQRLVKE